MGKEKFIVTARQRLDEKELDFKIFNFPIAIFSFFKSMADVEIWEKQASRFNAKRINHPKSDDSRLHWGKVIQWPMSIWDIEDSGIPIVFIGPVLGGPWVAMALEELKVLGLKYAIGVGAHGSFSERLQLDDIVICDKAVALDGTSREYAGDSCAGPSQRLLGLTEGVFLSENRESKRACAWTTDALYRESLKKIEALEALEAFRSNPNAFDIVVSDMTMPNMTGAQLTRELISIRPDIPIIICTGFSERIDRETAAGLGVKGFLMKPALRSEMAAMVRDLLDGG